MGRGLLLALVLLAPGLAAAAPSVSVRVDRESIRFGETLRVTVKVTNDLRGADANLEAPGFEDWNVVGQQKQTMIDGVKGTRRSTLVLSLQPTRTGQLKVGSFTLSAGKFVRTTPPVPITVTGSAPGPAASATPPRRSRGRAGGLAPSAPDPSEAPPDDAVFVEWAVSSPNPWLGQQVDAYLYLYVNDQLAYDQMDMSDVALTGFWNHAEGAQPRRKRPVQVRRGALTYRREEVVHYRLFPIRAGEQTLPELKTSINVRRRVGFGGRWQRVERVAPELKVNVRALPEAGRPKNFGGPAVGAVRLEARLDRTSIDGSEAAELTVTSRIIGGLLANLPKPTVGALDGFRGHRPATQEKVLVGRSGRVEGERRTKYTLTPTRAGRLKIPSFSIAYFDPATGRYRTARTRPLTLNVSGSVTADSAGGGAREESGREGPPLRTIRRTPALEASGGAPWRGVPFWAVFLGAPLLLLAGIGRDRLAASRAANAPARAQRESAARAAAALGAVPKSDVAEGYGEIARVLVDFLETRTQATFKGLTHEQLSKRLGRLGVDEGTIRDLIAELENCDYARYAPSNDRAAELTAAAERARALVERLEEALG